MDTRKSTRSTEPTITMSDVSLPPFPVDRQSWEPPRTYHAEAIHDDVKAIIEFRWYPGNPKGFVMDRRVSRADELAYGSMGRKQEERAKTLFPALEEHMRQALQSAGWRVIGQTVFEVDIWYYFGAAIEEQLAHLARRVWHGPYPRQGAEKIAPLDDETWLIFPPRQWHPVGDLELALYPEIRQIHVRRKRKEGPTQEQERTSESQSVAVVGSGVAPAFYRERTTRPVTFTCRWCSKTVTQQRYPGPLPSYCSETCEQEAQREKTRRRVQQLRARRKIKE